MKMISIYALETAASTAAATAADGTATTANAGLVEMLGMLLPLILMFVVFYFFLIRPQKKKDKKVKDMLAALKPGDGEIDEAAVSALREKFNAALGNDLNTSLAITALYDVLKYKTNDATKLFVLDDFDKVLSLDLCKKADEIRKRNAAEKPAAGAYSIFCEDGNDDPAVTAQIQARYDAKKAKNFAEADRIRDELKAQGIEITDIPGGAKWKHI